MMSAPPRGLPTRSWFKDRRQQNRCVQWPMSVRARAIQISHETTLDLERNHRQDPAHPTRPPCRLDQLAEKALPNTYRQIQQTLYKQINRRGLFNYQHPTKTIPPGQRTHRQLKTNCPPSSPASPKGTVGVKPAAGPSAYIRQAPELRSSGV